MIGLTASHLPLQQSEAGLPNRAILARAEVPDTWGIAQQRFGPTVETLRLVSLAHRLELSESLGAFDRFCVAIVVVEPWEPTLTPYSLRFMDKVLMDIGRMGLLNGEDE